MDRGYVGGSLVYEPHKSVNPVTHQKSRDEGESTRHIQVMMLSLSLHCFINLI